MPVTIWSQTDLERVLGAAGYGGAVLEEEATGRNLCRYHFVNNGAIYQVKPQRPAEHQVRKLDVTIKVLNEDGAETDVYNFSSLNQHGLDLVLARHEAACVMHEHVAINDINFLSDNKTYTLLTGPFTRKNEISAHDVQLSNVVPPNESNLHAFVNSLGTTLYPGADVEMLPRTPFRNKNNRDVVRLNAAAVVRGTFGAALLVTEHKPMADVLAVNEVARKFKTISACLAAETSPQLAKALAGVSEVLLFLSGEGVRAEDEPAVLRFAEDMGVGVILPTGSGLGFATQRVKRFALPAP